MFAVAYSPHMKFRHPIFLYKMLSKPKLALLIFFLLSACCASEDEEREAVLRKDVKESATLAVNEVLRKGNGAEPQTLDPHRAEGVPASNILRDLYEGLIIEAPNGDLIAGTALSWKIDQNGTRYLFTLREDARWSNDESVTADDFVYGFRRSIDPMTGSKYSQILSPIMNAEAIIAGKKSVDSLAVHALDRYTLAIDLKASTPYFLGLLTHSSSFPVHRVTVEKYGSKFSRPNTLVSNGAYMLKEWVVQSHITLQRNSNYWNNDNTSIDQVEYHVIEDQSAELKRYRAGEIDWTESVPLGEVQWIRRNLADELKITPYLGTYYYGFNLTKAPFIDNRQLRQALSMAIDRRVICEKIAALGEIPAYGWIPPMVMNYSAQSSEFKTLTRRQQISQAQQLYRQAGYSSQKPLTVEIRYNTSENHKKIAIAIASMWKKVLGVNTQLINEEWKVFLQNRKQKKLTQVFRAGWIGDYNDAYTFLELMRSTHGINDVGYQNVRYDALLAKAAVESDPKKRRYLLEQAERLLLSDHAIIPIYFYVSKSLIKPYVVGFAGNIMDHHYSKNLRLLKR